MTGPRIPQKRLPPQRCRICFRRIRRDRERLGLDRVCRRCIKAEAARQAEAEIDAYWRSQAGRRPYGHASSVLALLGPTPA